MASPYSPSRRRVLIALAGLPLAAQAARTTPDDLMEEVDFHLLSTPQPVADPKRVEVIEFFYYGCRWCNEFQPHLDRWLEKKPGDVQFRYQPAIRNTRWMVLTKAFYALQQMQQLGRLHHALYQAFHRDNVNLEDQAVLTAWLLKRGVELKPFETLMQSDEIMAKVQAAREMTIAYDVQSTPSVVVDGRYLTNSGLTGGVARLMEVSEALVAQARLDRRAPPK